MPLVFARPVAVLVSGRGTNLQALLDAAAAPDYPARVVRVISNRPGVAALERAAAAGVVGAVVDHRRFADRPAFEDALHAALVDAGAELVVLAGFMRLLTDGFVERWRDRLINIHPSLLPAFKGLDTHARALAAGVRLHGCTVHFVRPAMDAGPIIAQAAVRVGPDDTADDLAARVLRAEHRLLPAVVRWWAEGRLGVHDERVRVAGAAATDGALYGPELEG